MPNLIPDGYEQWETFTGSEMHSATVFVITSEYTWEDGDDLMPFGFNGGGDSDGAVWQPWHDDDATL